MSRLKTKFIHIIFLLLVQSLIFSSYCCSFDLFEEAADTATYSYNLRLKNDIQVPLAVKEAKAEYLTVPRGTREYEIPDIVSRRRSALGLSSEMTAAQRNELLERFSWKVAKDKIIKTRLPGKIIEILSRGQNVKMGAELFKIEYMKMQDTIRSEKDGVIKDIYYKEGAIIEDGVAVVSLFPKFPEWEDMDQASIMRNKNLLLSFFPLAAQLPVEESALDSDLSNPAESLIPSQEMESLGDNTTREGADETGLSQPSQRSQRYTTLSPQVLNSSLQEESIHLPPLPGVQNVLTGTPTGAPPPQLGNTERWGEEGGKAHFLEVLTQQVSEEASSLGNFFKNQQKQKLTVIARSLSPEAIHGKLGESELGRIAGTHESGSIHPLKSLIGPKRKIKTSSYQNEMSYFDFSLFSSFKWLCGFLILGKLLMKISSLSILKTGQGKHSSTLRLRWRISSWMDYNIYNFMEKLFAYNTNFKPFNDSRILKNNFLTSSLR